MILTFLLYTRAIFHRIYDFASHTVRGKPLMGMRLELQKSKIFVKTENSFSEKGPVSQWSCNKFRHPPRC